jgi:heme/copper-type cytochrome/quinol oxidase subunit 3
MTTTTPMAALPAAGSSRPRNLLATGTAFVCAGATTFVGALAAAYVELRRHNHPWPPKDVHLDNYLGNMLVITLLLGAITVQWSVSAVLRDERRQAKAALAITIGLGLAFLNLLSYSAARQGFGPADHAYGALVTAMVLSVGLLVGAAVAFCIFTVFRVAGSQVTAAEPDQARATAWFWHFTTLTTIVVWYVVVVLK